jgi:hypothetical protein
MWKYTFLLAFVWSPAFLVAQKIDTEFDQAADYSKYKSFAIRDGQLNAKAAALNNDLVRKRIENDIRAALIAKGLFEATTGQPDLNVRFTLGAARRNEVDVYPTGWYGLGQRRVVTQYTQGTLVMDLRDTAQRALVWRAIASAEKNTPSDVEKKLDDMVRKSFDKYPPKK